MHATSLTGSAEAGPEETRRVGLALLAAVAAGDLGRVGALLHPNCAWWIQGWGTLDRTSLLHALASTIGRSASRRMDVVSTTAEQDRVAIVAEGEFMFAEGAYRNSYHYLFTIAAGQVIAAREYLDTTVAARFFAAA